MLRQLIQKLRAMAGEARKYHDMPPEGEAIVRHIADMEQSLVPLYEELYKRSAQLALDTKTTARDVMAAGIPCEVILMRLTALQKETEWVVSLDGKVFTETTRYRAAISDDERILKQAEERARMEMEHIWEESRHIQRELEMQMRRMDQLRRIPFAWAIMELKSLTESGRTMRQRFEETLRRRKMFEHNTRRFIEAWQRVRGLPELGEKIEDAVQDLANGASILKGHLDETLHMIQLAEASKITAVIGAYAQTLVADAEDIARLVE